MCVYCIDTIITFFTTLPQDICNLGWRASLALASSSSSSSLSEDKGFNVMNSLTINQTRFFSPCDDKNLYS